MLRLPVALVAAALLSLAVAPLTVFADKISINAQYPVRGPKGPTLSPPVIAAVNDCSTHVYVESFVPHATVTVTLNGTIVAGVASPQFAFAAIRDGAMVEAAGWKPATHRVQTSIASVNQGR